MFLLVLLSLFVLCIFLVVWLQLSVETSLQPAPEQRLWSPPLFQRPVSTQNPSETDQQLHSNLQPVELQQRATPLFVKYRLWLVMLLCLSMCAAIVAIVHFVYQKRIHHVDAGRCLFF